MISARCALSDAKTHPMLCSACGAEMYHIDDMLVCEEGHTFKHAFEVSERTSTLQGSTKDKASQTKRAEKKRFPRKYARLIVFTSVFYEGQKFLGLENDVFLRLFLTLIKHENNDVISDYGIVSPVGLHVMMYLTKRCELEREYRPVLANEYMRYIRLFPLRKHVAFFAKEISRTSFKKGEMAINRASDYLNHIYNAIFRINSLLANKGLDPVQRDAILKMTKLLRNDMRMFFAYLDDILDSFCLAKSPSLVFYFKKFVYANVLDSIMFIPEIEICLFLYEYLTHFKVQVDCKEAAKKVLRKLNALDNGLFLTAELSASIAHHKSTNAAVMESFSGLDNEYARQSLKEFVADYLGINPNTFDEMRREKLKSISKVIDSAGGA